MPWVNLMGFTAAGYELANIGGRLASFTAGWGARTDPRLFLTYLLYLIPILGAATILLGFNGRDTRALALLSGLLPLAGFFYLFSRFGGDILSSLAIGAYLTAAASIVLISSAFLPKARTA